MTRITIVLQRLIGLVLLSSLLHSLELRLQAESTALIVYGHIRSELYSPELKEPDSVYENKVVVYSSNTWWRVIATPQYDALPVDCKRIPDGIRLMPIIDMKDIINAASTSAADVFPILYPPPGYLGLFSAWLAFSQQPELPIINQKQMRRFLNVAMQNSPNNVGTYSATYSSNLLSRLSINNDGTRFTSERRTIKTKGRFSGGYEEFLYELEAQTNYLGTVFPSKAKLTLRSLVISDGDELYNRVVEHITFESAELFRADNSLAEESRIMALDHRFNGIANKSGVNYMVTNDAWLSRTNTQIKELAGIRALPKTLFSERCISLYQFHGLSPRRLRWTGPARLTLYGVSPNSASPSEPLIPAAA